ncbi:hypothetical protein QGM71_20765 [Virgibacillus sp. C22-A2]|uniref:Uncharacterized protein n=1 Tax=Virgibacillus tibetensis TaxID=3042313 RepID=A0ABU6KL04_9BACI|nr:hypothetical protein [Virgibacillus sp. C22-A2]
MGWFIAGVIFAMFYYYNMNKSDKQKNYIPPPYNGRWENKGTDMHENWHYIEPQFDCRYVNLIETENDPIINLSRQSKKEASEVFECEDQLDADVSVDFLKRLFPDSTVKHDAEEVYINVFLEEGLINITTSNLPDESALEVIKCMDEKECLKVIKDVERHYQGYTTVFVSTRRNLNYDSI